MRRDTESDIADYRPSLRQCSESNYWSDNNICQIPSDTNTHLWNISFDKIDQSSEEKDQTISNEQLTAGMDKKQDDENKKSKMVQINEAANTIHNTNNSNNQSVSQNFAPGSNVSPSLLDDSQNKSNSKQTDSVKITGKKRQGIQSLPSQNGTEQPSSPPRKRQRKSALSKKHKTNDELSHQQLQAIQNQARDEFQAQMRQEGLYSQFDEFDTYNQDQDGYHTGFDLSAGMGMDMQYGNGHNDHIGSGNQYQNQDNNYNGRNNNNNNNNNSNNRDNNNNNNNSSAGRQNQSGAGGFPGGDPSDDDNDDGDDKKDNNNENEDDQDSDSQSEDSDDNNVVKGITVNTGNINNPINQVDTLLKQNEELQKQLKQSNDRINDLMTQLPNNTNNNDNNNNNNNGNIMNNQNSVNQINVYQELLKQQQLQMSQLMRYADN